MIVFFTGVLATGDGVTHSNAVGKVVAAGIYSPPQPALASATVVVQYWHDEVSMDAQASPVLERSYKFTVGGTYAYESVFTGSGDYKAALLAYLAALPDFVGWSTFTR